MKITVFLRNNTNFWVKVDGLIDTIAPNTALDDRTYKWESMENKQISFFSTETCEGQPFLISTLSFVENDGVKVNRGDIIGDQVIKLEADCKSNRVFQLQNGNEERLVSWEELGEESEINLVFNK